MTTFNVEAVVEEYAAGFEQYLEENKTFNEHQLRDEVELMNSPRAYELGAWSEIYSVGREAEMPPMAELAQMLKTHGGYRGVDVSAAGQAGMYIDRRDELNGFRTPQITISTHDQSDKKCFYKLLQEMFKLGFEVSDYTSQYVGIGGNRMRPCVRLNRKPEWYVEHNNKVVEEKISELKKAEAEKLRNEYFDRQRIQDFVAKKQEEHLANQAFEAEMKIANVIKQVSAKRDALTAEDEHYIAQSRVHSWDVLVKNLSVKDGKVIKDYLEANNFEKTRQRFMDKMRTVWCVRKHDGMTSEDLCRGMSPETCKYISE